MYQSQTNNFKFVSKKKTFISTMLVATLIIVLISSGLDIFLSNIIKPTTESHISVASFLGMILNVVLSVVVMRKVSNISAEDLGFHSKNIGKEIVMAYISGFVVITSVFLVNYLT